MDAASSNNTVYPSSQPRRGMYPPPSQYQGGADSESRETDLGGDALATPPVPPHYCDCTTLDKNGKPICRICRRPV